MKFAVIHTVSFNGYSYKLKPLFVLLWVLLGFGSGAAQQKFKILRLDEKIPGHEYHAVPMVQDSLGYLWISNIYGVNKYNGHEFVSYSYEEIFQTERIGDEIEQILKDDRGTLWFTSESGHISSLNVKGNFTSLSQNGGPLSENQIGYILPHNNKLWIATLNKRLLRFNPQTGKVELNVPLPFDKKPTTRVSQIVVTKSDRLYILTNTADLVVYDLRSKTSEKVNLPKEKPIIFWANMAIDKDDRLWIATYAKELGILVYDTSLGRFIEEELLGGTIMKSMQVSFSYLMCDSQGIIWLGTDGSGLFRVDPYKGELDILTLNIYDPNSLSSNSIVDLYEDDNGNLWISCNYGRINLIKARDSSGPVKTHSGALYNNPAQVLSIFKSEDGSLWLGTDGNGILQIDPKTNKEVAYLVADDYSEGFFVQSILELDANTVWVATVSDGFWELNKTSKKATRIQMVNERGTHLYQGFLLYKDGKKRIWVMTEGGYFVYSKKGELLAEFSGVYFNLEEAPVCRNISETKDGNLWMGTKKGLFKLEENVVDLKKSSFTYFNSFDFDATNGIKCMDVDDNDILWIVSHDMNLLSFNTKTNVPKQHTLSNEIVAPDVVSVRAQDSSAIWLGSLSGLWRLNPSTENYDIFSKSDGFLDSRFLAGSYRDEVGNLYFSSVSGVNYFDPDKMRKLGTSAKLVIEDINILNQPALSVIPDQLSKGIAQVDRIELSYEQSSFSIRFLAMEDVLSPDYHYAYRLKGLEDTWTGSFNSRTASFTKVPEGSYEFQVRAGTEEGLWDIAPRSVRISIAPPLYRHPLAYLAYGLGALLIVIALVRWLHLRRNLVIEQMERRQERELYQMKMDFFSKISHEVQTPLSLILIPIENMLRSTSLKRNPKVQRRLRMIAHNVKRLSKIVFELTAVRNLEIGKLKANFSSNDLLTDLKRVKDSFQELANRKEIPLSLTADGGDWLVAYDQEKLEHVFYNLLSNAFKFTPKGGKIAIELVRDRVKKCAMISFTNTGKTISKKDMEHIFKLFYQGEGEFHTGTGIGLALSRELMDLHHGKIRVRSSNGVTRFTLELPLDLQASNGSVVYPPPTRIEAMEDETFAKDEEMGVRIGSDFSKTVLIAEDNFELRDYLYDLYRAHYNVLVASDGQEAFELATGRLPHLIVSDIMMPGKTGIELVRDLRENKPTAHIPIILMTAEDSDRNRVASLRAGAIEYMAKPFSTNELLLKSHNIITRGERLKKRIKAELIETPQKPTEKSRDEIFLEELVGHVNTHLENVDFRVEELSKLMHMSHSALYRKCQSLTGKTLVEFVRSMRIKKAAMYLVETNFSVADAAYVVGFNDVKYFSKCFRKELGRSPTEYKKKFSRNLGENAFQVHREE